MLAPDDNTKASLGHSAHPCPACQHTILIPKEAGELLSVSPRTLETWRCTGAGPAYIKIGRMIRYRVVDLEAWIESRLQRHTSAPSVTRIGA